MTRFATALSLVALASVSSASVVRQDVSDAVEEAVEGAATDVKESASDAASAVADAVSDAIPGGDADEDAEATTAGASASSVDASPDASDDDDEVCFPENATVELDDGSVIKMSEVAVGDMVKVGVNEFSRVFMFTHKMQDTKNQFVSLRTATNEIELTAGHYLYVNGALAAASSVRVGDSLTMASGAKATVEAVGSVSRAGLYNPQTVSGNVIVNGVLASTYTTAVEPTFAHAILSPFRMLASLGLTFTNLESGGGALTTVAPKGALIF